MILSELRSGQIFPLVLLNHLGGEGRYVHGCICTCFFLSPGRRCRARRPRRAAPRGRPVVLLPSIRAPALPRGPHAGRSGRRKPTGGNLLTTTQQAPVTAPPATGIADPAPLGLAAFALTTFLLSGANAGWMTHATSNAWLPYALGYGGVVQRLAGLWEFRNRNVFGATAFGTYGGVWIGLGLWVLLVAEHAPPTGGSASAHAAPTGQDLAPIPLAFAM